MPRDVVTTPIGAVRLGESVRARSGAIGRIVRIVSFRDLDAAARRALPSKLAASADDDFVFVELYAKGKAQRRRVAEAEAALEGRHVLGRPVLR